MTRLHVLIEMIHRVIFNINYSHSTQSCSCGWKYFYVGQILKMLTESLMLIMTRLKSSIGDGTDSDQKLQGVVESIPMKRVTQPQDVANAAWYLGSDESSYVTGTTLEVDGGRGV